MAGATHQGPDRIDSIEPVESSKVDAEQKSLSAEDSEEQPLSAKHEKVVSPKVAHDSNTVNLSKDAPGQLGSLDAGGDRTAVCPPNIYAPQAQTFFYGGYGNATSEFEEYPRFLNVDGLEVGPTGIYNENPSLMFHTGYGYSPQMPYGPYSPVTTPIPSASGDGQLYTPQHFPFSGPYYQQPVPPSMPYITSPTPVSQAELTMPVDHQEAFLADTSNSNGMLFGPRPGYHVSYGSFGTGSFAGNSGNPGFSDLRQEFDGFGSDGFWSDWLKSPDGMGSLTPLSPAASPQPIGALVSFGQSTMPLAGMAPQQPKSFYGFGSSISSYDRGYSHGGMYHQGSNFGGSIPSLGVNVRSLSAADKGRRRGKGNASSCSCNGTPDFLCEQNRGPRATRPKNPAVEQNSSLDGKNDSSTTKANRELYNNPDFVTEYKDAKFFIIKSYSEDNVHKSIKYEVWASTANGNRKLDSAYHEAKEKDNPCPVFLFFSVNASAQFCGVAEMIGPVDFEKSVDYWQQDKWSGQFPVKWHIVKDVPNNLFRHIILENNDNKPVTNSRDTQEVKLEQGLEMLSILKNHEADMSILDDFDFYEEREKAMQERKARQQQQPFNSTVASSAVVGNEQRNPAAISGDVIKQISKSFAQAVRLEEGKNANPPGVRNSSTNATAAQPQDLVSEQLQL
ncbi:YTH domain-containing protein ECT4-like isoform X1 [Phoenix dactylifera]|uniref:YTH domain-containing family protein n=1 Tax=Phoenix dactylifera TaxID=42345 RepID=A0A8B7C1H8_PHODC|nr:YTH domain-containing protein ECT4-like isoform X1 [Phoenix dactylifera]